MISRWRAGSPSSSSGPTRPPRPRSTCTRSWPDPPPPGPLLDTLSLAALVQPEDGTPVTYRVHHGVAAAITAATGLGIRDAADTELAAYWAAVSRGARERESGEDSGLIVTAGLAAAPATPDDALSELAVSGQAITVEARTLAQPVSYELASSVKGEGIEDRATMAPLSARRLADMIALCARVAAIELVVAAQAIDLRALGPNGRGELGLGTGRAYQVTRELVPFTQADGTLPADLEPLVDLVARGYLDLPQSSPDNMTPC